MREELVRYAAAHGHRFWGWLYRVAPEDFSQTIQLSVSEHPSFNGMGSVVNRELNSLAGSLGFRRNGNSWSRPDQLTPRTRVTNKALWRLKYRDGKRVGKKCRCGEC